MVEPSEHAFEPLRVLDVPLPGIHAVEASAGTGKTWNIAALYLRLLLETDLVPERILVVTYTVAATAELRARIRERIQAARHAFLRHASTDPFLGALLERFPDHERSARRLGNALRTFDEAAIFTIHGFCQRVLTENAFESGAPLHTELLADQSEIVAECVEDFWRTETYAGSPAWTRFVLDAGLEPERLRAQVTGLLGRPFERIFQPAVPADTPALEAEYAELFERAAEQWHREREAISALLQAPGLSRVKYRPGSIPGWSRAMHALLSDAAPSVGLFERFHRFTPEGLLEGTNQGKEPPRHPFFETCGSIARVRDRLASAYQARLAVLWARLLEYCNSEIRRRKQERRVRSFDDLLIDLEQALAAPSGPELAHALRTRFGAALIDEFQDTDALQYSIFRRIYRGSESPVFLVGDPKQAIYAFRGADVYAYLRARREALGRHGLDRNHRSDRGVVEGLNTIFGGHPKPFVTDDIPFHAVHPAHPDRAQAFRAATGLAPVRAWLLPRDEDQAVRSKKDAESAFAEATADEIARLLQSGARIPCDDGGSEPIHGGHIAVLVRTHPQGRRVRKALSARGIPAVEESRESVFAEPEAEEISRLLAAIADPGDERLLRGALATSLLGVTAERLAELAESEHDWEAEVARFHEYRRSWLTHGFGQMFRRLLLERDVARRVLGGADGERGLTNLLQIGELLSQEAITHHSGCEKLLQWLTERRRVARASGIPPPEHLLRLESDDDLVQIATLHASKGLEYPIVFVPFAWAVGPRSEKRPYVTFHPPDSESGRPCVDFGSDRQDEFRRRAAWETLAEELRLFYVALTRAKHHCTFGWGAANDAGHSAPAWLFHGDPAVDPGSRDPSTSLRTLTDADLWAALEQVAERSAGHFAPALVPTARTAAEPLALAGIAGEPPLHARTIERDIRNHWRITSFSALRGGRAVDQADRDGRDAAMGAEPEPTRDVFGFPRGARAGVCLHKLFELWDFADPDPAILRRLVEQILQEFAFPAFWAPTIERMARDVVDTSLDHDRSIRLREITRGKRLDEIEFHYPAGRLTLDGLNGLLEKHGYPAVPDRGPDDALPRPLVDGYVKGYVDLIFEASGRYYLVDYKSNWLGSVLDAYRPDALEAVVRRELYTLQYVTYTLALHRFLRLRLPGYDYDRDVGGAYYLFVRGMRPEHGATSGVFFDRPPRALIEALDERIGPGHPAATGRSR